MIPKFIIYLPPRYTWNAITFRIVSAFDKRNHQYCAFSSLSFQYGIFNDARAVCDSILPIQNIM